MVEYDGPVKNISSTIGQCGRSGTTIFINWTGTITLSNLDKKNNINENIRKKNNFFPDYSRQTCPIQPQVWRLCIIAFT